MGSDVWTSRAARNLPRNLDALRDKGTYRNFDRYKRCVIDLNRLLSVSADGARLSLSDYDEARLSPVRSADLLSAAARPENNPFYNYFSRRLREILEGGIHSSAGFSLTYLSQALTTFAMIGFVRQTFPAVRTVLGGGLVSSWMASTGWQDPFGGLVDHLVRGPGEDFLLGLMSPLSKKGRRSDISPYAYEALPLETYLAPGMVMPYSTSTGCYYGACSFCPERAEGNSYIQKPPGRVASALSRLVARMKPTLVHIVDNAISPATLKALVKEPPGAPWYGFARVTPELADRDFCEALKGSGCVMLKLGVESGDQRVLDGMRKGIELSVVSKALRSLSLAGIATYVYLLFGTPWEDEASARKTLNIVVDHHESISFLNLAVFNLPLKSPDAHGLELKPFYGGDLSLYADFVHPSGWDRKKVRRFLDKDFTRHPVVRKIVNRQPPYFTSNHAPLFSDAFC